MLKMLSCVCLLALVSVGFAQEPDRSSGYTFNSRLHMPQFASGDLPGVADGRLQLTFDDLLTVTAFVRDQKLGRALWIQRHGRPLSSQRFRWVWRAKDGVISGFIANSAGDMNLYRDKTKSVHHIAFTIAVHGAQSKGTWVAVGAKNKKGTEERVQGNVEARLETWPEIEKNAPVIDGVQWPQWAGPTHDFTAAPYGEKIVDHYAEIMPLWRSEEVSNSGVGNTSKRGYGNRLAVTQPGGGSGAPILANGKLYLYYHNGDGRDVPDDFIQHYKDTSWLGGNGLSIFQFVSQFPWGEEAIQFERDRWGTRADAVVVCIDAATGKTVWREVFQGKAVNIQGHTSGPMNLSPAYADGRLYVVTSAADVLCLDAATGKLLWDAHMPGMPRDVFEPEGSNRCFQGAPMVIDGVLLFDYLKTLYAWNAGTGAKLWQTSAVSKADVVPTPWFDGKRWVAITYDTIVDGVPPDPVTKTPLLVAYDVKTGERAWAHQTQYLPYSAGVSIEGDSIAFTVHDTKAGEMKHPNTMHVVYGKLTPEGFQRVWMAPLPRGVNHSARPIITNNTVISGDKSPAMLALNRQDGSLVKRMRCGAMGGNGHTQVIEDKIVVWRDNHHARNDASIYPLDVTKWPEQGAMPVAPPHYVTSPYSRAPFPGIYANGFIFLRGGDGIYAYDMRYETTAEWRAVRDAKLAKEAAFIADKKRRDEEKAKRAREEARQREAAAAQAAKEKADLAEFGLDDEDEKAGPDFEGALEGLLEP
ncbi:MAG: PQQ-like beta-propeller repeat protein [Epibacterium sp.]|nr:PQQ-like beta-propeller repeat protein [Epibacterium sp.]